MIHVISFGYRGIENVEGGIERHANRLYAELAKLGYHIEVISRAPYSKILQPHVVKGVTVTPLWAPQGKGWEAFCHSLSALVYAAFKRPDLVHIHGVGAALLAPLGRAMGLCVVVTHHGQEYDASKWGVFARSALRIGEWAGMMFANQRIVVSRHLHESVRRKFRRDSALIPNGVIMLPPVADHTILSELGLARNRYLIEVARFTEHKGQDQLIHAFSGAGLQNWKLVLVGSDDAKDTYSKRIVRLAARTPNVVLAGQRSWQDLAQLYSHAGLFALPSSYEGMPISALEALGFGVPVVLSDIPAHRELDLPEEHYFPAGNIDALKNRIVANAKLADSQQVRALMRSAAASRPGWRQVAEQTHQIYVCALPRHTRIS